MVKLLGRYACPRCVKKGNDSSGDNLAVYDDNHTYCFSCDYLGNVKKDAVKLDNLSGSKVRDYKPDNLEGLTMSTIAGYSSKVLKTYGVALSEGTQGYYIKFPYTDNSGNLVSHKLRKYNTALGTLERDFYFDNISPQVSPFPCFNYRDALFSRRPTKVLVFEGETDLLQFAEAFGTIDDVVYVALSGVNTATVVLQALWRLPHVTETILFLDNDSAGRETYSNLSKTFKGEPKLLKSRLNFRDTKDVKELLLKYSDVSLTECLDTEKIVAPITGIISDKALEAVKRYAKVTANPVIDFKATIPSLAQRWLPRKGNVFTIVGGSGRGKSFFTEWMISLAIRQGKKILLLSLEMSSDDVIVRLVHRVTGINLVNTPFDNLDLTLQEVVTKACSLIDSHIYLADSNGSMSVERLREILGTLPEVMDFIVVDTFSNMAEGMDWKILEELANHLKEVAVDKLLGEPMVLIVSQVSEAQKDNTSTFIPNFMGVRGGKGLAYASSAMIGVCYNQSLKTTTIAVIKPDRMVGSDFSEINVQFSNGDYYEIQSTGVSQEVLQAETDTQVTYDY